MTAARWKMAAAALAATTAALGAAAVALLVLLLGVRARLVALHDVLEGPTALEDHYGRTLDRMDRYLESEAPELFESASCRHSYEMGKLTVQTVLTCARLEMDDADCVRFARRASSAFGAGRRAWPR